MTVAAILNQQLWLTYFLLVVGVAVSSSALSVLGYSMLKYRRPRDAKRLRFLLPLCRGRPTLARLPRVEERLV